MKQPPLRTGNRLSVSILQRAIFCFFPLFTLLCSPFRLFGQNWDQIAKIVASDRAAGGFVGYDVAISGDYAIVGAYGEDKDASGGNTLPNAGAAYIFKRNGTSWVQEAKLVASDRGAGDFLGWSVAISGDYAIAGAHLNSTDVSGANNIYRAGAAYIFKRSGSTWIQEAKIVAADRTADDYFGLSVAISSDHALIGVYKHGKDANEENALALAGAAYVFKHNGTQWTQEAKLLASDRAADARFGHSVAVDGAYAVVGAFWETKDASGNNPIKLAGAAYVYKYGGAQWTQDAKLVSADRGPSHTFGSSVDVSGDYIIVGARMTDTTSAGNTLTNVGAAYIFKKKDTEWTQEAKIVASDRKAYDIFGAAVAIDGDRAIVGAYGADEDAKGANKLDLAGAAYVYKRSGTNWKQEAKIVAADRAAEDFFATTVDISGPYAIVGAPSEDDDAAGMHPLTAAGSAYIFMGTGLSGSVLPEAVKDIRVYPNPANGLIRVESSENLQGGLLQLFDLSGRRMHSRILNESRAELDVSALPSGAYLIEIQANMWVFKKKIVKK